MSSDFEVYEQEFGTLTAEITNKIGRVPKLSGGKCCPKKKSLATKPRQLISSCNASELETAGMWLLRSRYSVSRVQVLSSRSRGRKPLQLTLYCFW